MGRAAIPSPRYLGRRSPRPSGGTRLVLWRWSMSSGRERVNKTDCPACADGKIEVGGGSDVAECLELAKFMVRSERGSFAERDKAARFADEVVAFLPTDVDWSVDACSIREWVDDIGRVRATWGRADHVLPPDNYTPRSLVHPILPPAERAAPVVLDDVALGRMGSMLNTIEGEAF